MAVASMSRLTRLHLWLMLWHPATTYAGWLFRVRSLYPCLAYATWIEGLLAWDEAVEPDIVPACLRPSLVAMAGMTTDVWKVCRNGFGFLRVEAWRQRGDGDVPVPPAAVPWLRVAVALVLIAVVVWTALQPAEGGSTLLATTYYVRRTGNDASAGTSAGTAWATLGKALGAAGIASGDTLWVGAGVYPEAVTVAMTSPTATTYVIADVTGEQTGDAGEVVLSAWSTGDWIAAPVASAINLGARDFLTFRRLTVVGANTDVIGSAATATDITIEDCTVYGPQTAAQLISCTVGAGVAANWVIDRCRLWSPTRAITGGQVAAILNRHSADYDANILVRGSLLSGGPNVCVRVVSTGAGAGFGGGVEVLSCTLMNSATGVIANDASLSTTYPTTVTGGLILSPTALNANTLGQIVEDYNILMAVTARTNVAVGTHSTTVGSNLLEWGQALFAGKRLRAPFSPYASWISTVLGFGVSGAPATDIDGLPRPCGTMTLLASGTATSGAAETLTDTGATTWQTNGFRNATIKITGGTGSGQVKSIDSNTLTVITVDGNWKTQPDNTSTYAIYFGAAATTGTATAGAATSLTDGAANWQVNRWAGYSLTIDAGTGSGQTTLIVSNTATVLTVPTWTTNPDNTSTYRIYKGTDENTVTVGAGASERGDTLVRNTSVVRTGTYSLQAVGPATQDFAVPVNAAQTTITVYTRWDATYAGTKPQMKVLQGGQCGVADATATAVGSAGSWEQLSLTFTPTAVGIVTIRLQANSTATLGMTYFDDFAQTPSPTPKDFDYYRRGEPWAGMMEGGGGGSAVSVFGG